MERKSIDWKKTGYKLLRLRSDSAELRRFVCRELYLNTDKCNGGGKCEICEENMDNNISRPELAVVFHVTDNVIFNWEKGKTRIGLEDILFYCQIANVKLEDILVFED